MEGILAAGRVSAAVACRHLVRSSALWALSLVGVLRCGCRQRVAPPARRGSTGRRCGQCNVHKPWRRMLGAAVSRLCGQCVWPRVCSKVSWTMLGAMRGQVSHRARSSGGGWVVWAARHRVPLCALVDDEDWIRSPLTSDSTMDLQGICASYACEFTFKF